MLRALDSALGKARQTKGGESIRDAGGL